jgi:hypothetical protein
LARKGFYHMFKKLGIFVVLAIIVIAVVPQPFTMVGIGVAIAAGVAA